MHEKSMKTENKQKKRKGRMVLPAQEDKNLEENSRESDKKIGLNLDRSKRERERERVPFEKF